MPATAALLNGIKTALRSRKLTYRGLAVSIGVSEATVKRDLRPPDGDAPRFVGPGRDS